MLFIPCAGLNVQEGDMSRVVFLEVTSQQLGEQWVVAIPALLVVKRDDEQVGVVKLCENDR